MHALKILPRLVARVLPAMHALRQRTLILAVESLLRGRRLTLMELARSWPGAARVRAPLKRLDRLLSNPRLLGELPAIEASLSQWLLRGPRPVVVVDWSELTRDGRWMVLRAGVPVGGRTLTLIERVYPSSQQNSPPTQKAFLSALSGLVPKRMRLLVVTDAGFRSDLFRDVAGHGWDFLGRIREERGQV